MLEPSKRQIDGFNIQLSPLASRKALEVFHRLGKSVSPSIAGLLGLVKGGTRVELTTLDFGVLGEALLSFFEHCAWVDLDYFLNNLLAPALCNDAPLIKTMDVVFQGKTLSLLKVLIFAVEVNYSDFFDAARSALAKLPATQKTDSISKAA